MMTRKMIAVVGMGNLHSVVHALEFVSPDHVSVCLTLDVQKIQQADAVLFPGQGAAASCMQYLEQKPNLIETLLHSIDQKPFLGICMGMQVLFSKSEENDGVTCLNKIKGSVKPFSSRLNPSQSLKIPHMGWNDIRQTQDHPLWHNIRNNGYFYFVHSYYCHCEQPQSVFGTTEYGTAFTSVIADKNWFAIQAHPEKSGDNGLQLLRNFIQTI